MKNSRVMVMVPTRLKRVTAILLLGLLALLLILYSWNSVPSWPSSVVSYLSSYYEPSSQLFGNQALSQNDPRLLEYIRQYHLSPPSSQRYNLTNPRKNPSLFSKQITKLFGSKKNGIFIECGALDGEDHSNTLLLEKDFGWSGLLVEANHVMIPLLRAKHRKAWISDACLSYKPYPLKVTFLHNIATEHPWQRALGVIQPSSAEDNPETKRFPERKKSYVISGEAECFPLFSILAALEMTTVDYFTLDVEGLEYKILQTIPFDLVKITVISVEHNLIPEGKQALEEFMASKGYRKELETDFEGFFVHNELYKRP